MKSSVRNYLPAFAVAFLFVLPSIASAASLDISPSNITTNVGGTVTETVFVSSADQAMNAVSGTISFPADLVQVVSISKANSVLSLWVQDPTFSNTDGTISFSGVVPNPGYIGSYGEIFSIKFRGKHSGTANVIFKPSLSEVLANDGNGTDILNKTGAASISVNAAAPSQPSSQTTEDLTAHITSSTHPDQTQWYKLPHAVFDWTNSQGVSAVRIGYDRDADGKPNVLYSTPISHKELDFADGIWYLHVQERNSNGWGPIASYRVQVDTVSPLPFSITFAYSTTTESGTVAAQFTATDELSGIDHYQVSVDGNDFSVTADEGNRQYTLSASSGAHMLLVSAYDKAGNVTTENNRFAIAKNEMPREPFDLFAFGWLAVNYISIFLIAFAVGSTILFALWYGRVHISAYHHRLNRRLGIARNNVHKESDELREAITEEIFTLENMKSQRPLTREEERIAARFKKLLDIADSPSQSPSASVSPSESPSMHAIEKDIEDSAR